jgi:hypothetical protein
MSFPAAKAAAFHFSPAIQEMTLASMAEKSETTNFIPSRGTKAVRIS